MIQILLKILQAIDGAGEHGLNVRSSLFASYSNTVYHQQPASSSGQDKQQRIVSRIMSGQYIGLYFGESDDPLR